MLAAAAESIVARPADNDTPCQQPDCFVLLDFRLVKQDK
jgi:hypothetical protein